MCVSYASRKCFTVIGLWPVGWCDRCLWPAHTMQQLLDRFVFRIGPTTVAFVKSTGDNCLWCAHTMQQSSFRRLCVQQTTKIAWCVPGLRKHLYTYQHIPLIYHVYINRCISKMFVPSCWSAPANIKIISMKFDQYYVWRSYICPTLRNSTPRRIHHPWSVCIKDPATFIALLTIREGDVPLETRWRYYHV